MELNQSGLKIPIICCSGCELCSSDFGFALLSVLTLNTLYPLNIVVDPPT
ncbi:hypothetical protein JCM19233_5173 [Vibrio astriarenae]|nr:hypothetical protein JCM19233_5173 [Vibrio sp. C7]